MIEVDEPQWREGYEQRLRNWYGSFSDDEQWASHYVGLRLSRWDAAQVKQVFRVAGGYLALKLDGQTPETAQLVDLWIEPEERGRGHGRAALAAAIEWASARAARLTLQGPGGDPALDALLADLPVRATGMIKPLTTPPALPDDLVARQMTEAEFIPWRVIQQADYAEEMLEAGMLSREEAEARSATQFDELLPDGVHTANQTFLCLEVDGDVVGTNWLAHHNSPHTSWVFGVEVGSEHRGKGYGRAAMLAGETASLAAGDTQLGLNVFGHNEVAMRLYYSLGYRAVEVFRSIELAHASGGVPAGDQRRGQQEDPDGGAA